MAANNPLLNPGQPLQGQGLQQAATALTNAQTSGPLAELARQIANNNRQNAAAQQKTAGYFNTLGQYVNLGNNAEQGIANDLNSQLHGIQGDTQGAITQAGWNALGAPGIQGLAASGLDGGAVNGLAQEIARQQGIAAQNAGTYRSFGATQGANYRGLAASNAGVFGLKGQEALTGIAKAGRLANEPINAKIADLHAQRGALLAANEGKLRQQEITNKITREGILAGLTKAQIAASVSAANNAANNATSAANNAANNATSRANNAATTSTSAANNAATNRTSAANNQRTNANRGTGPKLTPTGQRVLTVGEQQRYFSQISTVQQLIKDAQAKNVSGSQIRGFLLNGQNPRKTSYNPAIIDAAFALDGWGYLTPAQIAGLNKLGLIVGNRYKRGQVPQSGNLGLNGSLTQ